MDLNRLKQLAGIQVLNEGIDKPHIEITKGGTTAGVSQHGLFISIDGKTAEALATILGIPKDGKTVKIGKGFAAYDKSDFLYFSLVEADLKWGKEED